jgi:hypothetical protein
MGRSALTETDEGWLLPLRGATVTRCYVDQYAVGFLADEANVYLEGQFKIVKDGDQIELGASDEPTQYIPLLALIGQTVSEAEATREGELALVFSDGTQLNASPDPAYEAWNVTVEGWNLVSLPGGRVATFGPGKIVRAEHLRHGGDSA